jgi:hypothetical protein
MVPVSESDNPTLAANELGNRQAELAAVIDGSIQIFSTDSEKFDALAAAWSEHHIGAARLDFEHHAYQQIIEMRAAAVPFILERIRRREVGWLYAMKRITGEEPNVAGKRGEDAMVAWLDWALVRGYKIARF